MTLSMGGMAERTGAVATATEAPRSECVCERSRRQCSSNLIGHRLTWRASLDVDSGRKSKGGFCERSLSPAGDFADPAVDFSLDPGHTAAKRTSTLRPPPFNASAVRFALCAPAIASTIARPSPRPSL